MSAEKNKRCLWPFLYSYTFLRAEMRLLRLYSLPHAEGKMMIRPRRERPSGRSSARAAAHCGYRLFRRRHTVLSRSQRLKGTPSSVRKHYVLFQGC